MRSAFSFSPAENKGTPCIDECTFWNETECNAGKLRTCQTDEKGCRHWSAETVCENGCADATTCRAGCTGASCNPGCVDECGFFDDTECSGGKLRTCKAASNGCLAWSSFVNCPLGSCADEVSCTMAPQKRVFVTSAKYSGALDDAAGVTDGLAAGDKLCQMHADAAGLGGSWQAWLSSSTVNAIDRLVGSGPWFRTDGVMVFAGRPILNDPPQNLLILDERGRELPEAASWSIRAWTGTDENGAPHSVGQCSDWKSDLAAFSGRVGNPAFPRESWTTAGGEACISKMRLYCLEK